MTDILTTRFRVDGMDCAGCAAKVGAAVKRVKGVDDVSVSVAAGSMLVTHRSDADLETVGARLAELGYRAGAGERVRAPHDAHARDRDEPPHEHRQGETAHYLHGHDHGPTDGSWWKAPKALLTAACGLALVAAFAVGQAFPAIERSAFVAAMLVGLAPIVRRAWIAARYRAPDAHPSLMTIAAVGAVAIGAAEEAAAVVFLFLVGELLEGLAAGRARSSIQALGDLLPKTAMIEEDGATRVVQAADLPVGAVIMVRPGDRIPADGEIVAGESAIDESPVSGESAPVSKAAGDRTFAGSVNGEGVLRIRVTAAAADNTIARIVKLVEEAQESKAPTERFIDRFSRWYTPGVLAAGFLVAVAPPLLLGGAWSEWIYKGLALLLIGCPCALVISVPAAVAAALSAGARRGLLMKGGAILERFGAITAVALDKTGTLTAGKPQVVDILAFARSERDVLRLAAALETGSSHPLASAILAKAKESGIVAPPASGAKAIGGKGVVAHVEGSEVFLGSPPAAEERTALSDDQRRRIAALNDEGKTVSVLLVGAEAAGAVAMRDEPRPDAAKALKAMADAGLKTMMLTGDNKRAGEAIGRQLGVDARAELTPEDKQRIVGALRREGHVVAKVGDGINDAPALAAADIGVAMGGGTDVALETADAAVLHGRVMDIVDMIALSKAAMANIRQNIVIALGLKAVFLVTTISGITGLWPAILADTGATVLVTANAIRLLRWRAGS